MTSPNFGARKLPISLIVLHYTGMQDATSAIERLCDPEAGVSAHYVVKEDGEILQLVDEESRAWHAGLSFWRGIEDINSASIGIEVVNGGHDFGLPDFPDTQIDAVITLCRDILIRHNLAVNAVIGHSDIAPGRKTDPGEKFPWAKLAQHDVGIWPEAVEPDRRVLFSTGDRDRGVTIAQRGLAQIGYRQDVSGYFDQAMPDVVEAFQRRFRSDHISGIIDVETLGMIGKVTELS